MGAAIAVFPGARALRVPGDRFAPVKTTGDLLAVASDAFTLTDDWRVVPTPGRAGDLVVDLEATHYGRVDQLDAHFPAGPPSLVACTRLRVTGDVRFGAGVVCRGEVAVSGGRGSAVPDGAVLSGSVEIAEGGTSSS
jgi:UTP--glucose-1-phosphate uridylyltransferase